MIKRICLMVIALLLAACGQAPPVPTDHYYRLTPLAESADRKNLTEDAISIEDFIAEGLYNDRAVLYSNDEHASELQQHHYYFWYTSPPHMLRDYLLLMLRAANVAPLVMDKGAGDHPRISGKLMEFERRNSGEKSTVNVALELRVDDPDTELPLLLKQYRTSETINNNDMDAVVTGFNIAVDRVYREFIEDLASALNAP